MKDETSRKGKKRFERNSATRGETGPPGLNECETKREIMTGIKIKRDQKKRTMEKEREQGAGKINSHKPKGGLGFLELKHKSLVPWEGKNKAHGNTK